MWIKSNKSTYFYRNLLLSKILKKYEARRRESFLYLYKGIFNMGRTGKSKVSRKVLAGMSQNPEMTDRALSTKISVKSSTASTARMRLKEMGAYRVINIPNFSCLSPGGVSVEYGKYK